MFYYGSVRVVPSAILQPVAPAQRRASQGSRNRRPARLGQGACGHGRAGAPARRRHAGPGASAPEGPERRPERPGDNTPSHTRRRGQVYRYYVTRETIAGGYDTCPITTVPAADIEGAVLDHVLKLLAAPELVARIWTRAKDEGEVTEREVTTLLAEFATVWNEFFPAEQARIVQLLVERVDVHKDALEVRIRAEGLVSLVGELRQQGKRKAA